MFVVRVGRRTGALTLVAALAVGLAALATPAEATSTDLVVVGGTDITEQLGGPLTHIFYVNLTGGTTQPAGSIVAAAIFQSGVQPHDVLATGPVGWDCTVGSNFVSCTNHAPLDPGKGATRFRVGLNQPAGPLTANVTSVVDPANRITESNENNNQIVTTYHFVQ